jgi:hypothetical protein
MRHHDAAAYEYCVGANAYWMPSAATAGDTGSVDVVLDSLQVCERAERRL